MAQLREEMLFQAVLVAGVDVIYNVPPGWTAVIRSIRIINNGAGNRQMRLYMRKSPSETLGTIHAILPYTTLASQKMIYEDGFKALNEGGQVLGEASAGGDVVVVAWGALVKD